MPDILCFSKNRLLQAKEGNSIYLLQFRKHMKFQLLQINMVHGIVSFLTNPTRIIIVFLDIRKPGDSIVETVFRMSASFMRYISCSDRSYVVL